MTLQILWFILWGVLWIGYFVLDGFDLGTGILYPFLAKSEIARSAVRRSIGPVWDGNEVWLLTAGGATFAAFPAVYASMFSFLYTALLLVLFGAFRSSSGPKRRARSGPGRGTPGSSSGARFRRCSSASPSGISFAACRLMRRDITVRSSACSIPTES
jgi:hypothetical protein